MGVSTLSSSRFSTPWAQPPLELSRSRYRSGFLWFAHLFALTQLLFFAPDMPTPVVIGVVGLIAVSGGFYRVLEPGLLPVSLYYDGQQWRIGYAVPLSLPKFVWRCVRAPSILERLTVDQPGLESGRSTVTVSGQLVREASTIYRTVLALVFESESGERFRIDVWRDQLSNDQYRRLYVLLSLGR